MLRFANLIASRQASKFINKKDVNKFYQARSISTNQDDKAATQTEAKTDPNLVEIL